MVLLCEVNEMVPTLDLRHIKRDLGYQFVLMFPSGVPFFASEFFVFQLLLTLAIVSEDLYSVVIRICHEQF